MTGTHAASAGDISKVRTIAALRKQVLSWRAEGLRVALVPTMGALHAGHLSLVTKAKEHADKCVVSIFVNPTQFAAGEDLDAYPRTEDKDCAMLVDVGADLAFIPGVEEVYPTGFATSVTVAGLTDVLCGEARPTHFDGVALMVTKLLNMCLPDVAIFGEKDYQQLLVIKRFVTDLNIPVEILGGAILREDDGLAMSSRNQYLTDAQRALAPTFPATLRHAIAEMLDGMSPAEACTKAADALIAAGFDSVDYIEVRALDNLELVSDISRPARLFGAARLGKTRLIDNWPLPAK